jgi:hypothetical protein
LGDLGIDGVGIKCILKKKDMMISIQLMWLTIWSIGGLL